MEPEKIKSENHFSSQIEVKAKRKLKSQKNKSSIWMGLGMMGMVGWSVAVPTLLGAALGLWLDKTHPQFFSWTLTLLITGLITGSVIAGYWVANEDKEMHQKKDDDE
jgi:ATP synthase protein I